MDKSKVTQPGFTGFGLGAIRQLNRAVAEKALEAKTRPVDTFWVEMTCRHGKTGSVGPFMTRKAAEGYARERILRDRNITETEVVVKKRRGPFFTTEEAEAARRLHPWM